MGGPILGILLDTKYRVSGLVTSSTNSALISWDKYAEATSIEQTTVEGSMQADRQGFRTRALTGASFRQGKPLYHVVSYDRWNYNFTCTMNTDLIN